MKLPSPFNRCVDKLHSVGNLNSMEQTLYKEELLDHYRHPRNHGSLSDATVIAQTLNPSCGDHIQLYAAFDGEKLSAIRFTGKGCVISQAAASMLTEQIIGLSLEHLEALDKDVMLNLVGIPLGPTRLRCALLALEALHRAVAQYRNDIAPL